MKKFISLFLLCLFFIIVNFTFVYGVDINMNLPNSTNSTNELNDYYNSSSDYNTITNESISETNNSYTSSTQKVSTTSASDEDFHLTVSDIINIILIAVGIVIILLAIAILIKIK